MNTVELARYYDETKKKIVKITVSDYEELIANTNKKEIADFIFNRLSSRYIRPYEFSDVDYKKTLRMDFQ